MIWDISNSSLWNHSRRVVWYATCDRVGNHVISDSRPIGDHGHRFDAWLTPICRPMNVSPRDDRLGSQASFDHRLERDAVATGPRLETRLAATGVREQRQLPACESRGHSSQGQQDCAAAKQICGHRLYLPQTPIPLDLNRKAAVSEQTDAQRPTTKLSAQTANSHYSE